MRWSIQRHSCSLLRCPEPGMIECLVCVARLQVIVKVHKATANGLFLPSPPCCILRLCNQHVYPRYKGLVSIEINWNHWMPSPWAVVPALCDTTRTVYQSVIHPQVQGACRMHHCNGCSASLAGSVDGLRYAVDKWRQSITNGAITLNKYCYNLSPLQNVSSSSICTWHSIIA